MGKGIGVEVGEPPLFSSLPSQTPQDAVGHPAATASGCGPDLVDCLGDGGVGGHTAHEKELIGTKAEKVQYPRGKAGKSLGEVEVQEVVQPAP
jgi:hypothetical protein